MNYSLIKKLLALIAISSIIATLFYFDSSDEYMKEIGALIKLKGLGEEKQHSLDLQKMRPSFAPESP